MQRPLITFIYFVLIAVSAAPGLAQRTPISYDEAKAWAHYTIPLPKSLEIPAKIVVPKTKIALFLPAGDDIVTGQIN